MSAKQKKIQRFRTQEILASVVDGYNSFAEEWNVTRQHNWYEFTLFAQNLGLNGSVLDVGCGNARLYPFLQEQHPSVTYTGIDNSTELIGIATRTYPGIQCIVGDALALPFGNESFSTVASFAVLHHITPRSNRQQFFAEIARVLTPGGRAFVTVWNLHQPKYMQYFRKQYFTKVLNTFHSPFNPAFAFSDCLIPFGEHKTLRYVHGFTPNELERLAAKYFTVENMYFTLKDGLTGNWQECRNICIELRKR